MQQRHIQISNTLYQTTHYLATIQQVPVEEFYFNAFEWFLPRAFDNIVGYLPNFRNGYILSLWLTNKHMAEINTLANYHQITEAKVIYTALIHYVQWHQLI